MGIDNDIFTGRQGMNLDDSLKLKVLLYSDAAYAGGAEKYLYYLARYLPCRKHLVIERERIPARLKKWLESIDIPVTEISGGSAASRLRSLYRLIRDTGPDIFHMNLPGPFDAHYSIAAPVARAAGVKNIISTEHLPMVPPFLKSRVLKGLSTRFIDCVITVSRDNRRHLIRQHHLPDRKIRVVYNGIPDPAGRETERKDHIPGGKGVFRVAVIGSLLRKKGQKEAIEGLAQLDQEIHLYLAGEGEMESRLRELTLKLGLENRVHFMGYVDDIFSFLSEMDLLLVPSSIEATPYTVIEGMAMGVPVLASDIFGIPEVIEDGRSGILIQREKLHSAIRSLFENRSLMEDISREGRKRYEKHFRVEKSIKETMNIYREVKAGRGALL
ncbi:MAG: glycosyltransferase [Candidatus Latescibacteria bacterium]|nr:glycosyltransferase [bacterium]MBD3423104.1 glycosyltransferase [Candidatus Latescibacterota bacterium]